MESERRGQGRPHAVAPPLPYGSVKIADAFWGSRRELMRTKVLLRQWEQLERTGCVDNFRIAAGEKTGSFRGWGFADSDLYKWLEAASWALGSHPGHEPLSRCVAEAIGLIRKAQRDDGYLHTYYQIGAPGRRYSNLLIKHELYCLGHLIEAGCTHRTATGATELFDVAVRAGDHVCGTFGPGRDPGVPGHEEVELALVRLYRATGEPRYLETARFFLEQRGRPGVFRRLWLRALRDLWQSSPAGRPPPAPFMPREQQVPEASGGLKDKGVREIVRGLSRLGTRAYFQMHAPLREHRAAEGHAVRAMYLYAAAADLLLESGEPGLRETLERVWDRTYGKRTYITGGMGAFPFSEGFGRDYDLPNRSYTETCAAIGSWHFCWRMLQASGDGRFAGQMERTLYNAVLGCLSADGERYFYSNPLRSEGHTERQAWYDVPCCPPNLARLFGSLEQYIYGVSEKTLWVHQYIGSRASVSLDAGEVTVNMTSGFPFDGRVRLRMDLEGPARFALKLRIPEWSRGWRVQVNGEPLEPPCDADRYAEIDREWRPGDEVSASFPMEPAVVEAHPRVRAQRGRIALRRGPVIYCVQGVENPGLDVLSMRVDPGAGLDVEDAGGVAAIIGRTTHGAPFRATPYYRWGNRGRTPMAVWIRSGPPARPVPA